MDIEDKNTNQPETLNPSALESPPKTEPSLKSETPPSKSKKPLFFALIALIVLVFVGLAFFFVPRLLSAPASDEIENYSIEYLLDNNDFAFLTTTSDEPTKYEIFDNYSDYKDCYDSIDTWASDTIEKRSAQIEKSVDEMAKDGSVSSPEEYKKELKKDYERITKEKVKEIKAGFTKRNYSKDYFSKNTLVLIEHSVIGEVLHKFDLRDLSVFGTTLNVEFYKESAGVVGGGQVRLYFLSVPKALLEVNTVNIEINAVNTSVPGVDYKPVLYLYPTEETNIVVKLSNPENLTSSYPEYVDGWSVLASPNGDLVDNKTGRNLYSLYYESENKLNFKVENDGFVVKGEDVARFLEEKLAILGLTERESEEFIIYWLPKLEKNEYNYIRFASAEEIAENVPLEITPAPTNLIRVLMTYKKLSAPISVTPQALVSPDRSGFIVVEWGGTEIK